MTQVNLRYPAAGKSHRSTTPYFDYGVAKMVIFENRSGMYFST